MPVEHEGALRYFAGRHQRRKLGLESEGLEAFELDRDANAAPAFRIRNSSSRHSAPTCPWVNVPQQELPA